MTSNAEPTYVCLIYFYIIQLCGHQFLQILHFVLKSKYVPCALEISRKIFVIVRQVTSDISVGTMGCWLCTQPSIALAGSSGTLVPDKLAVVKRLACNQLKRFFPNFT